MFRFIFLVIFVIFNFVGVFSQQEIHQLDASATVQDNRIIIHWGGESEESQYRINYFYRNKTDNKKSEVRSIQISRQKIRSVKINLESGYDQIYFSVNGLDDKEQIISKSDASFLDLTDLNKNKGNIITTLNLTLKSFSSTNFPFIFAQVSIDTAGIQIPNLSVDNFLALENNIVQTDYFQVTPPDSSGGVRISDIIFLMDNSGSMSDVQTAVVNNVRQFVDSLIARGIDMRLGLVRFGQNTTGQYGYNGSPIVEDNGVTTADVNYFKNTVLARNVANGGFEPGFHAAVAATQRFTYRPGVQKIYILITDEDNDVGPSPYNYTLAQTNAYLNGISAIVYGLVNQSFGTSYNDYVGPGSVTQATGGRAFQIRVDQVTTMLNYIQFQASQQYTVRYKSSNPNYDGTLRNVAIVVNAFGNTDTVWTSYRPGDFPRITRNPQTIDLSNSGQPFGNPLTIQAWIVDYFAPSVTNARVYYKRIADASYLYVNMTNIQDSLWSGVIPGAIVTNPGIQYYITATDGIVTSSDPSIDPATSPYYIAVLPNEPPQISHIPFSIYEIGTEVTITTDVTDVTTNVAEVRLYYRKTGTLLYNNIQMILQGGDTYSGIIPLSFATDDGIDYYIKATDNYNVSSYHGTSDLPHKMNPEYILKRVVGVNTEIFQLNNHAWSFDNWEGNMWPEDWWRSRFDYSQSPPYPWAWRFFSPERFPDWPLFVDAFGESQCYWNPPPGVIIYNPKAVAKWVFLSGPKLNLNPYYWYYWGGSCFGFAISSYLFFDTKLTLTDIFPGRNNIYEVPIQDDSRKLINLFWIYQFGKTQQQHIDASDNKTPNTTLKEIKQMLSTGNRDDKILVFYNQGSGGGGHAVNLYKVRVGSTNDTVYIYDNNAPNLARYILINKISNSGKGTWDYPEMSGWGGNKGLFLMDPVSNYLTNPVLPKSIPPRDRWFSNDLSNNNYDIYMSPNMSIKIHDNTGKEIGYENGIVIDQLDSGHAIIPITGSLHSPIGFYVPKNEYSIQMKDFSDSNASFSVFTDSMVFLYDRNDAENSNIDNLTIGNNIFAIGNHNNSSKNINCGVILETDESKVYKLNNIKVSENDSLQINIGDDDEMVLQNLIGSKLYDLRIENSSQYFERIFEHKEINLSQNSTHKISPSWDSLDIFARILQDKDNNGQFEDTLVLPNKYLGEPYPLIVKTSWNLLSIPVKLKNPLKNFLFPNSNSDAYAYTNKYIVHDSLWNGRGYWLKFNNPSLTTVPGSILYEDTILIVTKWNMIGSISYPVSVQNIISDPPSITVGSFYRYDNSGGYIADDTIRPGYGYWVKASQEGKLILSIFGDNKSNNCIKLMSDSELPPPPPGSEQYDLLPKEYAIEQNYPNPFNPNTEIKYQLPVNSRVTLKIYNLLGQEVKTLADEIQPAGYRQVEWNSTNNSGAIVASGMYFYRIEATSMANPSQSFTQVKKMLLLK